jgi:hypothetical protein
MHRNVSRRINELGLTDSVARADRAFIKLDIGEDTEREGMRFPRDRMGLL